MMEFLPSGIFISQGVSPGAGGPVWRLRPGSRSSGSAPHRFSILGLEVVRWRSGLVRAFRWWRWGRSTMVQSVLLGRFAVVAFGIMCWKVDAYGAVVLWKNIIILSPSAPLVP